VLIDDLMPVREPRRALSHIQHQRSNVDIQLLDSYTAPAYNGKVCSLEPGGVSCRGSELLTLVFVYTKDI